MKRNKYILMITMTACLFIGTSCSQSFLDNEPTSALTDKMIAKDLNAMGVVLQGVHSMLYTYSFNDQLMTSGQPAINIHLDMLGDDLINTMPAYWMGIYRWLDVTAPQGSLNYYCWDYYSTVNQHLNQILVGAAAYHPKDSEKEKLNDIMGQAYVLRAWANFNLVQLFGKRFVKGEKNDSYGVILRESPSYDPKPRSTVAETYDFINRDMEKGLALLKNIPEISAKNKIKYSTACGIAARIALTQQEYKKAEELATEAIEKSGAHFDGKELLNGFNDWNASEWMWAYHQSTSQNLYYESFFAAFSYNYTAGNNRGLKFAVNRDIYDKMGEKDIRRGWWVCKDLNQEIPANAAAVYFDKKAGWEYTGQSIKFASAGPNSTMGDVCIMRLAEMYYIKAEAQYHEGKMKEASSTLNAVMASRDSEYKAPENGPELFDEIMRNKRIDLWEEGQRFFDMKRLGVIPDRSKAKNFQIINTEYSDKYQQAMSRNTGSTVKMLPQSADDVVWQFAIPYQEIKGNNLCQLNPLR